MQHSKMRASTIVLLIWLLSPWTPALAATHARHAAAAGAGVARSAHTFAEFYAMADVRNLNGAHGNLAEHLGHFWDTVTLVNDPTQDTAHLGSDNANGGPDRRVGPTLIQVKYHSTPSRTLASMFKTKDQSTQLKYRDSASYMRIEVPKDQYASVLALLQERISKGLVDGITDPAQAQKILQPGFYTYKEARDITLPGTVAGVKYDIQTGAISGIIAGGTSFMWQVRQRRHTHTC